MLNRIDRNESENVNSNLNANATDSYDVSAPTCHRRERVTEEEEEGETQGAHLIGMQNSEA